MTTKGTRRGPALKPKAPTAPGEKRCAHGFLIGLCQAARCPHYERGSKSKAGRLRSAHRSSAETELADPVPLDEVQAKRDHHGRCVLCGAKDHGARFCNRTKVGTERMAAEHREKRGHERAARKGGG